MEFVNLGAHCALSTCKQQDFLPFTCELCNLIFCLDHRTPDSHSCSHASQGRQSFSCPVCNKAVLLSPSEDPNITWERHNSSSECARQKSQKCPVKGCRTKMNMMNSCRCEPCRGTYCFTHRYTDSHDCVQERRKRLADRVMRCVRCHLVFWSENELRSHMQKVH